MDSIRNREIKPENEIITDDYLIYKEKIKRKDLNLIKFKRFWGIYKNRITGLSLSLITAICLLSMGFFKTLLVWIVMLIGYSIGAYFDRDRKFLKLMDRYFKN